MSLKFKWIDDPLAEEDYRTMNIPFIVKEIRFSLINLVKSADNCARLGAQVIKDKVEDYAHCFRNGNSFYRTACYLDAKYGYVFTSGNQRGNAIKLLIDSGEVPGDPLIQIYELQTKDEMLLEAITRSANVSHGVPNTIDERILHAVHMVSKMGMTLANAEQLYRVSQATIALRIRANTVRKELGEASIDTSHVPTTTLEHLSKIDNDSRAFVQIGALVAQHVPTGERVKQIVNRVARAKSDPDRLKVVKQVETELTEEAKSMNGRKHMKLVAPKSPSRPWRDKLISSMNRLCDFLDFGHDGDGFEKLSALQVVTQSDERAVRELWARLELRMAQILKKGH